MSDVEEEYEVESIQRAKVVKKGNRKIWNYFVKWKGYGLDANTWEPVASFKGSEHFIENFWKRIGGKRDYHKMDQFDVDEEVFPVGPPPKMKQQASGPAARSSPRRPSSRRKPSDSEGEVLSMIDVDAEEPVSRPSTRKRRTSTVEQPAEAPAAKRRRSRNAPKSESPEAAEVAESISAAPTSARQQRTPRSRSRAAKPSSARATRSSASPAKRIARRPSTSTNIQKKPRVKPSVEVISVDSSDETSEQETSEAGPSQPAEPSTPIAKRPQRNPKANGSANNLPAHHARTANPRVKTLDAPIKVESSLATKARITRKLASGSNGAAASPAPRAKIAGTRAGPGRSSQGIVTGSTSLLTGTKQGVQVIRKRGATPGASRGRQIVNSRGPSVDPMMVDEPELMNSPLLAPLSADDLTRLAELTQARLPPPADHLPDFEATSDRDAEGEIDHEFVPQHAESQPAAQEQSESAPAAEAPEEVFAEAAAVEELVQEEVPESAKAPDVPPAPKEMVINPPDAAIGNGSISHNSSFAAWKTTTIFDNPSTSSFQRFTEPTATSSEPAEPLLSIPVNPSTQIPVILKDIHAPIDSTRVRLDDIVTKHQAGPPGKFYKGQNALDMVKAFDCKGSCARVVLVDEADGQQKDNFDRFCSRLKDASVFVAMIGSHVLAFCASENTDLATKLGASPNLVGLGDNVVVSEVVIADDSAYCDVVLNAEDDRW